ncbi:universal stress protein [Micromonospora sp. WMMA1363]|uniref:universal stress protein n=1 Tax=Micromonospora sp. WMMA1363 TaxID=3053985 RepID=UPI00259CDDF0|nr:universal stress protein [Micromonospora sp. WMMA1363]MDM4718562.1 universal stress protein [Micromonospora sp. WMMA1363]
MNRPVVAGVDGSPSSLVAAEHAARAAVLRTCPLHLVHGYLHPLGYGIPINPYEMGIPAPSEEARKMLDQTAADLVGRWPGLNVEVRQIAGGPGATLVEESRRAELVVVGSRGLGGFGGLLLGSVGAQVAAHARCPVLVVRPAEEPIPVQGPVLVGVDGSEGAELAVGYAADEAARREVELVLVHVRAPGEEGPAETQALLDTAVAATRGSHPGLTVTVRLLRADKPESALIEASGGAGLVVVGTRGRGGFTGMLLGSVSQSLVQHAHCPVLVAHPYRQAR